MEVSDQRARIPRHKRWKGHVETLRESVKVVVVLSHDRCGMQAARLAGCCA